MYYVGKVVCAPCNANCWGALCSGCGRCCEECLTCGGCCCPENRPSPLFLGFTVLLNLVPGVVFTIIGLLNIHNHCDTYVPLFFYITAAINLFFTAFAIHVYTFFSRPYDVSHEADKGPVARACHVFWNDPWVAFFVLFFIGGFIWSIVGFSVFASASCGDAPLKGHYLPKVAGICAALLLVYIIGSLFMIVLSLLLECFRRAPVQNIPPPPGQPNHTPQSIIGRLFFPQQRPPVQSPPMGYIPGYAQTAPPPPMVNMVRPAPPQGYTPSQIVQMGYPLQSAYGTPPVKPGYEASPPRPNPSPIAYGSQPASYGSQPTTYEASVAPGFGASAPIATPLPPGYVPYEQVHGPYGREQGVANASRPAPPEATAGDKVFAIGKRLAGNVGTGLKKLGAFVEEAANGHGASSSGSGYVASSSKR